MHNGGLDPCSSSWQWLLLMTTITEERSKCEDRNKQGEGSHHCWYSLIFILQDTSIWLMIPVFTIEDTTKEAENEEKRMHTCPMVCPAAKLCRVPKWDSILTPLLAFYTMYPFSASINSDGEERIELDLPAFRRSSYRGADCSWCIFSLTRQVCSAWIICQP